MEAKPTIKFVVTWIDPETEEAQEFVSERLEAIYAKIDQLNKAGPVGSFFIKRFREYQMSVQDGRH